MTPRRPTEPRRPLFRLAVSLAGSLAAAVIALGPAPGRAAFTDVSAAAGLTFGDVTFGCAWGDLEGDGDPDLFVCRHFFRPTLYRNLGDGTLSSAFFPPLFENADHHGPLVVDLDDDGDLDIYLTKGVDAGSGSDPAHYYRNDGNYAFVEMAAAMGLDDVLARGRSSSAMDVEGDGDVDLFVAKAPRATSPNSLFLNDGTPSFVDIAAAAGVADDFGSVGCAWADFDRDGDPDFLISGEEQGSYETRLYRNEGDLTFTDVTATSLPGIGQLTSAAWGDYDQDGDLDLAAGLGDEALFDAVTSTADSLFFFFNARGNDDGLDGFAFLTSGDSTSFDQLLLNGFYQSERIFISSTGFHPPLNPPFTLAAPDVEGAPFFVPGDSTGFYIWTDTLFPAWQVRCSAPPLNGISFGGIVVPVDGQFTSVSPVAMEPYEHGVRGTRLFRNDGSGSFSDVTVAAGIGDTVNVRHVTWVDVDLDGHLDLHVLNKGDTESQNLPNVFYRNLGDGTFQDDTAVQALEGSSKGLSDACAFEDYDGDGDLDLAIVCGASPRFFAQLESRHRLYRNEGANGNSLRVDLDGVYSTADGYGAWVLCVSATAGRQTHYVAGNAWRGSHVMLDPFFGLGSDAVADTLMVKWPSGAVSLLTNVAAGEVVVLEPHPATDVPAVVGAAPEALRLTARPNPATGEVLFELRGIGPDESARLKIHDSAGRLVREDTVTAGARRHLWDGRDGHGRRIGAGVYFVRLIGAGRIAHAKIVYLR